jgi:hypothetical protein
MERDGAKSHARGSLQTLPQSETGCFQPHLSTGKQARSFSGGKSIDGSDNCDGIAAVGGLAMAARSLRASMHKISFEDERQTSLWDARKQEDMKGERQIHHKYFHTASGKKFPAVCFVEHVVMEASIIEVVERAPVELFRRTSTGIQA